MPAGQAGQGWHLQWQHQPKVAQHVERHGNRGHRRHREHRQNSEEPKFEASFRMASHMPARPSKQHQCVLVQLLLLLLPSTSSS